jgi:hypothetical protein
MEEHSMAMQRRPPQPTYAEQVATARANLERHITEMLAERHRALESGIDPETELDARVNRTFTEKALRQTWREYLADRGQPLADELAALNTDSTETIDARSAHRSEPTRVQTA